MWPTWRTPCRPCLLFLLLSLTFYLSTAYTLEGSSKSDQMIDAISRDDIQDAIKTVLLDEDPESIPSYDKLTTLLFIIICSKFSNQKGFVSLFLLLKLLFNLHNTSLLVNQYPSYHPYYPLFQHPYLLISLPSPLSSFPLFPLSPLVPLSPHYCS